MHSEIGPWREAQAIYAGPARIPERATRPGGPLVIYDLGLGIGANALCALKAWREITGPKRSLRIISFENDPSGLKQALESSQPSFLDEFRTEAHSLLRQGCWSSEAESWELVTEDFLLNQERDGKPELVFHDFYCPKTQPELWTKEVFASIRKAMHPGGMLLTYSAASAVRRALKEAGFSVLRGPGTDMKRESTHAYPLEFQA
jgi:tRNA U34 5-methylaminomethyl-2-thiouridine-forming methyltransferase MnmC